MLQNQSSFRLSISAKDLTMILSTIDTYSHNLEYRELRDRLQRQAKRWSEMKPKASENA